MSEHEFFVHPCATPGCETPSEYDDEPWCFEHSPNSGSSLAGYSARQISIDEPYEVITALVEELDKHGYGDFHTSAIKQRDPGVIFTLAYGRTWIAINHKKEQKISDSHDYTSMACQHILHNQCRQGCKFCKSKCACLCHNKKEENNA